MSPIPLNNDIATQISRWEQTPSYAPTPGDFGRERTPSVFCPSPAYTYGDPSSPLHRPASDRLGFLEDTELNHGGVHNEGSPKTINYLIEWKVTLNNRILAKDTEQDLVLKPSLYWQQIKEKAQRIVQRKKARNQQVRLDDTTVVVAVNECSQCDLTKCFEGTDIDWTPIETQLLRWENLFCQGKQLRLLISINYIEDSASSPKTDKRGNTSTTNGMLRDLHKQVAAEDSSGQPSIWRDVYRKMRCPGPPCHHEGQYCWLDPVGKKHYKMRTHHMKALVKYVEQGGILETHGDVPDAIRDQLYAEERQRIEKRQKVPDLSTSRSLYPPININVAPTQSSQPAITSQDRIKTTPFVQPDLDIPGPIEVAVEEYTNWHLENVSTDNFKENIRKARDIVLDNCLDLGQLHSPKIGPEFFVKEGVKIGVAYRFVNDTNKWLKQCKRKRVIEDDDYE